jgi:ferric-dicitrate binding protein FerR (iron transport regulator)
VSDRIDRREEPWWTKGLIPLVATGFFFGLIAWGANTYAVTEHGRRISKLEDVSDIVIDLRAQVRFLVEAEQRRQRRGGE